MEKLSNDIPVLYLRDFLFDAFGKDWVNWSYETIFKTIDQELSEILKNKIMALSVAMTTDYPWQEWHIFENTGKSFNHQLPRFDYIQPLTPGECLVTSNILEDIRGEEKFTNEVAIYVATSFLSNGMIYIPKEWDFKNLIQKHIDNFIYDFDLKKETEIAWNKIKTIKDIVSLEFKETPLEIQLGKLAVIQQYLKENALKLG